jgi:curved DNA-binding protein CbpA
MRLHPDRFGMASPLEREHAAQQAAAVNQAYDVLKRPLRRAHYIVSCCRCCCCCLQRGSRGWGEGIKGRW